MTGSSGAIAAGRGSTHQIPVTELGCNAATAAPGWPLTSYLELGALPTAIGCGRDHVRHVLAEWGLTAFADDAILLTSEILTNALKASQTLPTPAPIALRLLANSDHLIIEAWDQQTAGYELQPRTADDEHGRGLMVVTALSHRWGVTRINARYKAVWCELLIQEPT